MLSDDGDVDGSDNGSDNGDDSGNDGDMMVMVRNGHVVHTDDDGDDSEGPVYQKFEMN